MKETFKFIGGLFGCIGLCILLILPVSLVIGVLLLNTMSHWLSQAASITAEACAKTAERLIEMFDGTKKKDSEKEPEYT